MDAIEFTAWVAGLPLGTNEELNWVIETARDVRDEES